MILHPSWLKVLLIPLGIILLIGPTGDLAAQVATGIALLVGLAGLALAAYGHPRGRRLVAAAALGLAAVMLVRPLIVGWLGGS